MSKKDLKLVLIGETGIGKSQLGNFILKKEVFGVGNNTNSISENISIIGNKQVTIVDTPGLNDANPRDYDIMEQIISKFQNDKAIDGIILVYSFKKARKTKKDQELIKNLKKIFGEDILKTRLKVIMTNRSTGEEFDYDKQKIENQTKDTIKILDKMISKEDILFVNTLNTASHMKSFYPKIENVLEQFYKVKIRNDSMNNELIEKEEKKRLEKEKKELEEKNKNLELQNENERKRFFYSNSFFFLLLIFCFYYRENEIKRLAKDFVTDFSKYFVKDFTKDFAKEFSKDYIKDCSNDFVKSIDKLENSIRDLLLNISNKSIHIDRNIDKDEKRFKLKKKIFDLSYKIFDSEKEIKRLNGEIDDDNRCITSNSVFVAFTLGISGIGISKCLDSKKVHEKQLEIEKQKLKDLKDEKTRLENQLKELDSIKKN